MTEHVDISRFTTQKKSYLGCEVFPTDSLPFLTSGSHPTSVLPSQTCRKVGSLTPLLAPSHLQTRLLFLLTWILSHQSHQWLSLPTHQLQGDSSFSGSDVTPTTALLLSLHELLFLWLLRLPLDFKYDALFAPTSVNSQCSAPGRILRLHCKPTQGNRPWLQGLPKPNLSTRP